MGSPPTAGASVWDALVAAALLGTERAPAVPTGDGPAGALVEAASAGADPSRRLLVAAAVLGPWVEAGRGATRATAPPPRCTGPDRPPCRVGAARVLARLFREERARGLLAEWFARADRAGVRVPDELLPACLEHLGGVKDAVEANAVRAALGARGAWLARQHPTWAAFVAPDGDPAAAWATGDRARRLTLLARLRRDDPAAARALVEGTLAQEEPADREAIVAVFATGLSPADEPFLEARLDDRRKAVRTTAAELLARLPASAFARRMAARVPAHVTYEPARRALLRTKPAVFSVTLTGAPDAAALRDGLEASGDGKALGLAGLVHLVACTPLPTWMGLGATRPREVLDAAARTDFAAELLRAFALAAERQRDLAWAEALVTLALDPPRDAKAATGGHGPPIMLAWLPQGERERLVFASGRAPRDVGDGWMRSFLLAGDGPLSEAFGRYVLDVAKAQAAAAPGDRPWGMFEPALEHRLPPTLADAAARDWPDLRNPYADHPDRGAAAFASLDAAYRAFRERLDATLRLRAELHQELPT